ncbi:MAG: amidohydrolase family protein [Mariniblastus sp.]
MKRNLLALIGIVFCLLPAMNAAADNDAAKGTLYKASKVYTMAGEPISPGQVLVVDGKIKAVAETVDLGGASPKVVDLGEGSVLMPGLVDPYSQTGLGDDGSNETTDEITPNFRTIDSVDWDKPALRRQLESGTTTMCVCPGTQNVFSGIAAIVKTADNGDSILNDDGPLLASVCADPASGNRSRSRPDSIFIRQPTNRMGVVWILRKTFDKAKRNTDAETLTNVKQTLAGKRPLMMVSRMSHDLTTIATLADEFGFSPVIVGGQEAYKIKDLIAERKYPIILQKIATGSTTGTEGAEVCWNQAGVLSDAGVTIAFSGDDLLEQARFAHRYGLEKDKALAALTTTPASLLGVDTIVGSIEAGKDADLIALSGEPLEFTTSIQWVLVNGEMVTSQNSDKDKE